jgi:4-diphosphocytidyl-2-C-methyl-D-erythritol kinase
MTIEERAPAKLTWSLRILGLRADGFHDLEALTSVLSEPHDRVVLEPAPEIGIRLAGTVADVPADATNLAWRAAEAAGGGVAITLDKQIPAGAGLGGGSSDAAAVLRGLVSLADLDPARAGRIAADLGSDVPVCLAGGTAWMRGRGEVLEPIRAIALTPVVVAVPPLHSSTLAVYQAWDDLGGRERPPRSIPPPPAVGHLLDELVNDLEAAAEHVEHALAGFREAFAAAVGRPVLLAGSGSAYWTWFDDPDEARAAAHHVEKELGIVTFAGAAG